MKRWLLCATFCALASPCLGDAEIVQLPQGLDMRQKPPTGGAWNYPGPVTGRTTANNPYVVLRRFTVKQGFSNTNWTEVAPVTGDGQVLRDQSGWVLIEQTRSLTAEPTVRPYEGILSETARRQINTTVDQISY